MDRLHQLDWPITHIVADRTGEVDQPRRVHFVRKSQHAGFPSTPADGIVTDNNELCGRSSLIPVGSSTSGA